MTIATTTTESRFHEERSLLAALRAGNEAAFEKLVRLHTPRMLAIAVRMLRCENEAHDAVQDAFISAFKSLPAFQGESSLGTWLHRIVVNAALMKLRRKRSRREVALEGLLPSFHADGHRRDPKPAWEAPAPSALEQEEWRTLIASKLAELPADAREIIMLRDIESLDTAEAARLLGIKECTVKVRLHRARMMLRTLLERELVEPGSDSRRARRFSGDQSS